MVRLETLVGLRWLAVVGQTIAVLFVFYGLGFKMPLAWCLLLIAMSVALNLYLRIFIASPRRLDPYWAGLLLAYDVCQLAGLLYLTGGLENPFSVLLLVPALVSATILPLRTTIFLSLLVLALTTFLAAYHFPLPWYVEAPIDIPTFFIIGVWAALTSSLAFMAIYAWRVAEETRQLSDALAVTELILTREQHLSALDGLAAAAAHELGTPLATITLAAKELQREVKDENPFSGDIRLICEQAERCRLILGKITSLGTDEADHDFSKKRLATILEDVVTPHRNFGVDIIIQIYEKIGEPIFILNPDILYGLGNLLENAVDFARTQVTLEADWDDSLIYLTIADDGPGFAAEIIEKLGEPYVSTRHTWQAKTIRQGSNIESGGLGLGFFIAKTFIERSGAQFTFSNHPTGGAKIDMIWPRQILENSSRRMA